MYAETSHARKDNLCSFTLFCNLEDIPGRVEDHHIIMNSDLEIIKMWFESELYL